jgi:hypothetical protein
MENIRSFAIVVVDDFDNEIDRFNLDYADTPKNLGFELEFTTIESRLTTYFTSAREKKLPTTLNLNFLPPKAYYKVNMFKQFVQKHTEDRMVFEYYDTTSEIKNWEGKVQKLGQEELTEWGGLVCPMSFLPGTPKYIRKDNTISIKQTSVGKSYPFKYPYSYGRSISENNLINNTYFDEIPLRITLYGYMTNPQISLQDAVTEETYSTVRFENISIAENDRLIIDSIQSKILLYHDGVYTSAYDYVSKQAELDSFLYAKANTLSKVAISLSPIETGYLTASYRQYIL